MQKQGKLFLLRTKISNIAKYKTYLVKNANGSGYQYSHYVSHDDKMITFKEHWTQDEFRVDKKHQNIFIPCIISDSLPKNGELAVEISKNPIMMLLFTVNGIDNEDYIDIIESGKVHIENFRKVLVDNTSIGLSTIRHICSGIFKEDDAVNVLYDDDEKLILKADSSAILRPIKYKNFTISDVKLITEIIYHLGKEDKVLSDEQNKTINRYDDKMKELLTNI